MNYKYLLLFLVTSIGLHSCKSWDLPDECTEGMPSLSVNTGTNINATAGGNTASWSLVNSSGSVVLSQDGSNLSFNSSLLPSGNYTIKAVGRNSCGFRFDLSQVYVKASQLLVGNDAVNVTAGSSVTIPVLVNDVLNGAPLQRGSIAAPSIVLQPTKGTVLVNPYGTLVYQANPNASGTDVFRYQVCLASLPNACAIGQVSITISNSPTVGQTQWIRLADLPKGLGAHHFFSIGNKGYLAGGNTDGVIFNTVYEYDTQENRWLQVRSMSIERSGGVAFSINEIGYITLGGSNSMEAYNPATNTWTSKASFPSPDRLGSVVFVIGTNAYVGLGSDRSGQTYSDFFKYDSVNDRWTTIKSFPTERVASVSFVINGKGYVGTGLINWNIPLQSDLYEYDPTVDTWTKKASIPTVGRYAAIGFSVNGKGYIGTGEKIQPTELFGDIWEYNATNDSWTAFSTHPGGGVHYAGQFIINNSVFIGGGGYGYRSDFYKFSLF